jgi:hypothetical protein
MMRLPYKLLLLAGFMSINSQAVADYICLNSTEFKDQSICYTADRDKDLVAKKYFVEFTMNVSNPGSLVRMQGEMAKLYTPQQFHKSLIKNYSHATQESIELIISHGDLSAIFLSSGAIMYFNHDLSSFVFDFDSPLVFAGAHRFYAKGSKPTTELTVASDSNCNLQKDGVLFLSPQKDSFFYSAESAYCMYADFFFEKNDNTISVRPVSSIGSRDYTISGSKIEFAKFIKWLQRP